MREAVTTMLVAWRCVVWRGVHALLDCIVDTRERESMASPAVVRTLQPSVGMALVLVAARVCAAYFVPTTDCDETYNYWEPAHYLLYGTGKQTWEYAPQYALRSWFFVWLYAAPAWAVEQITGAVGVVVAKPALYYGTKMLVAALTAAAELYMLRGCAKRFGNRVAKSVFLVLLGSAGIAQCAGAFLPSSFAMSWYFIAAGGWLRLTGPTAIARTKHRPAAVCVAAVAALTIVGWPFAALVGVPIALDVLFTVPLARSVSLALASAGVCAVAVALCDARYYCRLVFSTWNIVKYNVFGEEGRGPDLYGVEPWHFFFRNLTLNFSLSVWFALGSPLVATAMHVFPRIAQRGGLLAPRDIMRFGSPFLLWFAFWLRIPHKEERFMAPAYPFLALAAGFVLSVLAGQPPSKKETAKAAKARGDEHGAHGHSHGAHGHSHGGGERPSVVVPLLLVAMVFFAPFRLAGMRTFYGAAERSAWALHDLVAEDLRRDPASPVLVCVGRDWYRYPSAFFLPRGNASYAFVTTKFTGALPKSFAQTGADGAQSATCAAVDTNDLNQAVAGQSIAPADAARRCDYFIDTSVDEQDLAIRPSDSWRLLHEATFAILDAANTPTHCRIGYLPVLSESCGKWVSYFVMKRRNEA